MLRLFVFLIVVLSLLISCSSDRPAPVAPAGKAADLEDLFKQFRQANPDPPPSTDTTATEATADTTAVTEAPADTTTTDAPADTTITQEDHESNVEQVEESGPIEALIDSFNIELVFTESFWSMGYTQEDADTIRYAAARWERVLVDIPDWELGPGWIAGTFWCGSSRVTQPSQVDDLTIFVGELSAGWNASAIGSSLGSNRGDWRTHAFGLTVAGCVSIKPGLEGEHLAMVFAHEVGHVLGFGNTFSIGPPIGFKGSLVLGNNNPLFTGQQAQDAYHLAGGQGAVPLASDAGHWRLPVLSNTLMNPHGNYYIPFEITTVDVAAIADLGYPVRIDEATPLRLNTSRAKVVADHPSWCGLGLVDH